MSENSLKSQTVRGMMWTAVNKFAVQGIGFVFGIILARLLSPSDYGLVGMIGVFTGIASAFIDSGFSSALIRKPDRTEVDNSTAFYFNIVVGLVAYGLLFIAAPFIANFYSQPVLTDIVRVVGISIILNSLCIVQNALLSARLDFKTPAKISIVSILLSGIIGIIIAYRGYGVWALVIQSLSGTFISSVLVWYLAKWRPTERFSYQSFKELFGFGSKLLASGLLATIYENLYPIVIGKRYSALDLGLYSRAIGWSNLPSLSVTSIIQSVSYPVLAKIQDDDSRLKDAYRRVLRMAAFILFPVMTGMAAIADPLVRVFITDKWADSIYLLQILCFSMMWYPIHAINLNLLQVKGRSDLFLRLEIYKKIAGIIILIITVPLGLVAMCYGSVVSCVISLILNTHYTGKLLHLGFLRQMRDLLPIFANSVMLFAIVLFCTSFIDSRLWQLISGIALGISYYIISCMIFKINEWQEFVNIIHRK